MTVIHACVMAKDLASNLTESSFDEQKNQLSTKLHYLLKTNLYM